MKNIKNIKASHKTRTDVLDFECESLLEVIAGRRHNGFHFSPKGKNVQKLDNCPWGVKPEISYSNETIQL